MSLNSSSILLDFLYNLGSYGLSQKKLLVRGMCLYYYTVMERNHDKKK